MFWGKASPGFNMLCCWYHLLCLSQPKPPNLPESNTQHFNPNNDHLFAPNMAFGGLPADIQSEWHASESRRKQPYRNSNINPRLKRSNHFKSAYDPLICYATTCIRQNIVLLSVQYVYI